MNKKSILPLVFISLLATAETIGQCTVTGSTAATTLTCGNCTSLSAFGQGQGQTVFSENFDNGTFGPGWGATQQAMWNNPCSPGGVNGTTHVWMGNSSPVPRILTTQAYNLNPGVAGVTICFDMMFATQGDAAPCEGPDEPDEGVYLQYSTDGGATWVDINYFDPNGGNDPQLTNWNNYCFQLPAAAISGSTMIRWFQVADSGADYDHWGIDNVVIYFNDPTYQITWMHDGYNLGAVGGTDPNPVCPNTTTDYIVQMTNGTSYCYDTVSIAVIAPTFDISAIPDTTICTGECVQLTGTPTVIVSPGKTPTYENNEISVVTGGNAAVNINITDLNMQQILPGSITSVCIHSFNFSGTQLCTNFGGCNCNGTNIPFGQQCNLNTGSFNVTLITPGGCEILLVPQYEAANAYNNVCFVPAGGQSITATNFPTAGTWNPQEPLSDLNGCDANGVWTLQFNAPGGLGLGVGQLTGWEISFIDPEISYAGNFSWAPATNMTGANTLTPTVCPTTTTNYVFTVSDTAGCATASETATVNVSSCSFGASVNSATVCPGACTNITATATSGTGPYTYSWSNGLPATAGPHNVCPASTTTYFVTITDTGAGTTATASGTVTVSTPPTANAGTDQAICTGASANLTASGGTTYAWSNGGTTASITVTPTTTTTYTVTVTGANTCTNTDDVTITVNAPPVANAGPDQSVCPGGTATITASGGNSYAWSNGTSGATISVSPATNTTYTVTVTGPGGCTSTDQMTVTVASALTVTITSPNSTICQGQSATLTATGATTYAWSTGSGTNPLTVSPATTTTYTVDGSSSGCTGSATFTVTVNPLPVANAGTDQTICTGGNATLTASGGNTYAWSSGGTAATETVTPGATTTYVVTVTSAAGCTDTDDVTVTITPPVSINVSASPAAVCAGATSTLTATGATSYSWSTGGTGSSVTVTPSATTTYTVTGNVNGCTGTGTVSVTVNSAPVANAGPDQAICQGTSATLTASGGSGYAWSGGGAMASINVTPSITTTYTVTVTEAGGCSDTDDVTVSVTPTPTSTFTASPINCGGQTSTIMYTGNCGSGASYTWNWGGGIANPGTGSGPHTISWTDAGMHTISLTVAINGCTSVPTTIAINNPSPLGTTISGTDVTCNGAANGNVDLSVSGGTPPYHYLWNNDATVEDLTNVHAGIYAVVVSDASGCTTGNGTTIAEPAPLVISVNPPVTICEGHSANLSIVATGGSGNYQYFWNNIPSSAVITVTPTNPSSLYSAFVTDGNGCQSNNASVTITVMPPVNITLIQNRDSICPGEPVMLSATLNGGSGPPYSITDQNGAVVVPPYFVYPASSGSYSVSVQDDCGTFSTSTVYIEVLPLPQVSANADILSGCEPLTVHFNESNPDNGSTYMWDFGDHANLSLDKNPVHTYNIDGTFSVSLTVTSEEGCQTTVTYDNMITVFPQPEAQFIWSPEFASIVKPVVDFTNMSTGGTTCMWSFGDGDSSSLQNPSHYYGEAGTYPVNLITISDLGCPDTITYWVSVKDEFTFFVPTAFSPDNDGINDQFFASGHGISSEDFILIIFDRWGQSMWETDKFLESTETTEAWDGRSKNGQTVPGGSYTWLVKFRDFRGILHEKAGPVTVIR